MASRIRFERQITKSGNSISINLPKEIITAFGLSVGDKVQVFLSDEADSIVIRKL